MQSSAIDEIERTFGYIDALRDLKLMPDEVHTEVVRDLHNARARIHQSLNKFETNYKLV